MPREIFQLHLFVHKIKVRVLQTQHYLNNTHNLHQVSHSSHSCISVCQFLLYRFQHFDPRSILDCPLALQKLDMLPYDRMPPHGLATTIIFLTASVMSSFAPLSQSIVVVVR
ncbi:hypothetical protein K432DRAFT_70784 [Lepidopterella palustris CBS 459.81]|uniref:Uncharacterized protein n=1 Tax=Lepidopterella palustris CBS 459.81 TaxID=1314670 RepID=A0A8E2E8R0_9PEZI|nr:hypothetical protein K432DRAFT_70784 [Lepidopterella palustris CBS 459.81]